MAASPPDCTALVPKPVDVYPIRSPQAVHSLLASMFAGKNVVEIGTRHGDGMDCFAQVAHRATAIEMDRSYCTKLVHRRGVLRTTGRGDFNVTCKPFQRAHDADFARVDYVTWWLGGLMMNAMVLKHLTSQRLRPLLNPDAEAVVLHDIRTGIDNVSFEVLRPAASWIREVSVPRHECSLCLRAVAQGQMRVGKWQSCGRATGFVTVMGFRLAEPRLREVLATVGNVKRLAGEETANWPHTCHPEADSSASALR